jgi:hypothetical protein
VEEVAALISSGAAVGRHPLFRHVPKVVADGLARGDRQACGPTSKTGLLTPGLDLVAQVDPAGERQPERAYLSREPGVRRDR